jgi:hypothetical protein
VLVVVLVPVPPAVVVVGVLVPVPPDVVVVDAETVVVVVSSGGTVTVGRVMIGSVVVVVDDVVDVVVLGYVADITTLSKYADAPTRSDEILNRISVVALASPATLTEAVE